jgi:hypothetical protein
MDASFDKGRSVTRANRMPRPRSVHVKPATVCGARYGRLPPRSVEHGMEELRPSSSAKVSFLLVVVELEAASTRDCRSESNGFKTGSISQWHYLR